MISDICRNCGKQIWLRKVGRTFKWLHNPQDKSAWRCGDYLTHGPQELIDAEDRARALRAANSVLTRDDKAPKADG